MDTNWSEFAGIPFAFKFEARFDRVFNRKWLYDNRFIGVYVSAVYVICVMVGQRLMRNRSGFGLRPLLFCWNCFLAILSICGMVRVLPEFASIIIRSGFEASYCDTGYMYQDNRYAFWLYVFALSKILELGDTIFIILRKQPLIYLHWIHHILTLSYVLYVAHEVPASGRWMVTMNYTIHSVMYSYYALKALGIRVPKSISKAITFAQICQMIIGLIVCIKVFYMKIMDKKCDNTFEVSTYGLLLYALFFLLFLQFFIKSYIIGVKHGRNMSLAKKVE